MAKNVNYQIGFHNLLDTLVIKHEKGLGEVAQPPFHEDSSDYFLIFFLR